MDYFTRGNLKGVALLRNLVTHKSSVILELIDQHSLQCKDFCALHLGNANIGKDEAMAIVSFLPKIKSLFLGKSEIGRDALMTLIRGKYSCPRPSINVGVGNRMGKTALIFIL
ncbi:unnamed protein product [Prunus armeniaca]